MLTIGAALLAWLASHFSVSNPEPAELGEVHPTSNINIPEPSQPENGVPRPIRLLVEVVEKTSGVPVPGAVVYVRNGVTDLTPRNPTDKAGFARFLMATRCMELLISVNYMERELHRETVPVPPDVDSMTARISVEFDTLLKFHVVNQNGGPVAEARLRVTLLGVDQGMSQLSYDGETDESGRWTMGLTDPLRQGQEILVKASKPGMEVRSGGGRRWISGDSPMEEVTLILEAKPTIRGGVLGKDGRPVPLARVQLTGIVRSERQRAVMSLKSSGSTNADGSFEVDAPRSGMELHIIVKAPGHMTYVSKVPQSASTNPLDIRLNEGLVIHGRVIDASGNPQVSSIVKFVRTNLPAEDLVLRSFGAEYEVSCDADGRFAAYIDPNGIYGVVVLKDDRMLPVVEGLPISVGNPAPVLVVSRD